MYDERDLLEAIRELNKSIKDVKETLTKYYIQLTRLETRADIDTVDLRSIKKLLFEEDGPSKTSLLSRIYLLENQQISDKENISAILKDIDNLKILNIDTKKDLELSKESEKTNFLDLTDEFLDKFKIIAKSLLILVTLISTLISILARTGNIDIIQEMDNLERIENFDTGN